MESTPSAGILTKYRHPSLEHRYQLWNQWKAKDIQASEALQRKFTYKIIEVQQLNYRERRPPKTT